MSTELSLTIAALAIVGIGGAYYLYKKSNKNNGVPKLDIDLEKVDVEKVDGTLHQADVVGFFKTQSGLEKGRHIPFLAKKEAFNFVDLKGIAESGKILIAGIYDEKANVLSTVKVFVAKEFDQELMNTLGNEVLVVLS